MITASCTWSVSDLKKTETNQFEFMSNESPQVSTTDMINKQQELVSCNNVFPSNPSRHLLVLVLLLLMLVSDTLKIKLINIRHYSFGTSESEACFDQDSWLRRCQSISCSVLSLLISALSLYKTSSLFAFSFLNSKLNDSTWLFVHVLVGESDPQTHTKVDKPGYVKGVVLL